MIEAARGLRIVNCAGLDNNLQLIFTRKIENTYNGIYNSSQHKVQIKFHIYFLWLFDQIHQLASPKEMEHFEDRWFRNNFQHHVQHMISRVDLSVWNTVGEVQP